jgi:aminoglycoside phosphotransferase (APT) family kinase protein
MNSFHESAATSTMLGADHHDRLVWISNVNDQPVVVKRYQSADGATIFRSMLDLWHSPFGQPRNPPGVPEPISFDHNELTMGLVVGNALGTRGDSGLTRFYLFEVAELIADLHGSGVEVPRLRTASKLLRSLHRKLQIVNPHLAEEYLAAINAAARIAPVDEQLVVSHGDLSPRNVLVTDRGLVLIDFDRLQMADRGRDLAYTGAWVWVTELLAHGIASWEFADELAQQYYEYAALPTESWRNNSPFFRSAALLRIAQSWSTLTDQPLLSQQIVREATRIAQMGHRS